MKFSHCGAIGMNEIYDLLYSLGLTANYSGFFHTAYAVQLVIDNPQRLLMVTKRLYPEVARHYLTTQQAVERNIRTVINVAWEKNPQKIAELARCPVQTKPTVSQFISILALSFMNYGNIA